MGLGKTIQVLALLQRRRARRQSKGPSLIVVPRSLVFNWLQEAAKFTPRLRVLDYTGPNRHALRDDFGLYDLIVTTYGTMRSDIAELNKIEFDYAILDEAQAIKNSESQSAKAARLLKSRHKLAMSGTPIENHLGELWSIFEFLNPGMLGTASVFKKASAGATGQDEEARRLLAKALRPFILRRTKQQVVKDLPDKIEATLHCDLEPEQRKLYEQLKAHYRQALLRKGTDELKTSKIEVLEALLRLRQAACHPGLLDKSRLDESSAKMDMLMYQMEEVIDEGPQGPRLQPVHLLPRHRQGPPRRRQDPLRIPRRPHPQPRGARRSLPERPQGPRLPHQPQGRRPRPEPHRRRLRLHPRPLVEPRRRGPGHRPLPPHRPDQDRLRLPPHRPRHRRGEDRRPPAKETRPRRGHPQRRQPPDPGADEG